MGTHAHAHVFYGVRVSADEVGGEFYKPDSWQEEDCDSELTVRLAAKLKLVEPALTPEWKAWRAKLREAEEALGVEFITHGHYDYRYLSVAIKGTEQRGEYEGSPMNRATYPPPAQAAGEWSRQIREFCEFMDLEMMGEPGWCIAASFS